MKDVIQNELAKVLGWLTHLPDSDEKKDLRGIVLEAFNAVSVEVDFMIRRLEGDAGLIERLTRKLSNTAVLHLRYVKLLKNYAARLKDSTWIEPRDGNEKNLIMLPGSEPDGH
jgi:hypothetical protein